MYATWIRPESVDAVLDYLARLVGYEWAPTDRDAVAAGLHGTSDEQGRWSRYELVGEPVLTLELANDAESPSVVHVRVNTPPEVELEIVMLLRIAGSYSLLLPERGP